jgi:Xaa-Pro dipeptidase
MGLHFSLKEFSKRKQDVLKSMKEQNLDALLMFRQESMYWLTGYDTFGYLRSKRKYYSFNSCT